MNQFEKLAFDHYNSINVYGTFISAKQVKETKNKVYVELTSSIVLPYNGQYKEHKHRYVIDKNTKDLYWS